MKAIILAENDGLDADENPYVTVATVTDLTALPRSGEKVFLHESVLAPHP